MWSASMFTFMQINNDISEIQMLFEKCFICAQYRFFNME